MDGERFRPNLPAVISEVIDGEAVIINLDSGSYYSLRGSGTVIWAAIERGDQRAALADRLVAAYPDAPATVPDDVGRFVDHLLAEGLIVPIPDGAPAPIPDGAPAPDGADTSARYAPPTLEVFTDMQELILLDPVHDVDAVAGWPTTPRD